MNLGIKDKVAVVTGGTSGIGRATAMLLAAEGAEVFVLARHKAEVKLCHYVECDVCRSESVREALSQVAREGKRVDILVNSAGIYREQFLEDVSEEDYRHMLDTNLWGTMLMCREVLPYMASGCIINVASDAALRGNYGCSLYAASKGAVVAFTRSFALDVAGRIRVNAVCPGDVDTPMLSEQCARGGYSPEDCGRIYPLGRVARPEEVAHVIAAMVSPENSFMIGAAVEITGGL